MGLGDAVRREVGTSEAVTLHSNARAARHASRATHATHATYVTHATLVHGEWEAKYASRSLGLDDAVHREVGTSEAVTLHSNARAVVSRGFPSAFSTTKIAA